MFDFFKDFQNQKYKKEKDWLQREEKLILTKNLRAIITVMGSLYFFVIATGLASIGTSPEPVLKVAKYILLGLTDIIVLICLYMKNKKAETAALIGIAFFISANYITAII